MYKVLLSLTAFISCLYFTYNFYNDFLKIFPISKVDGWGECVDSMWGGGDVSTEGGWQRAEITLCVIFL